MDIAQKIYNEAQRLPESLAREVLDFIGYIESKHRLNSGRTDELKKAQEKVMEHIWDNTDDEVWNDL
ncbi:MAG: DUF2281 domain-containing protein [Deltaproteobacteria bacterium]|nr:DUF2281 domain-containing protein [Deltaproteobacteria bacterium]